MAMNKRERSIAMAVGLAVAILFLNWAVFDPLWASRDSLQNDIVKAKNDYSEAVKLIAMQPILEENFANQKADGLPLDVSAAQSLMVNNLQNWGLATGVEVTNLNPSNSATQMLKLNGKPNEKEKSFMKLSCSAAIRGGMLQIGQFLYQIQTSKVPIRVAEMTFEPEKEGQDGLKISLKVSTIVLMPDSGSAARTNPTPASTRPGAGLASGTTRPGRALASGTTRPGVGQNFARAGAGGTSRPSTSASPLSTGPIIANPGNLSIEDQMKLRRAQQGQPQAANVAPATAPASQPETR